jgi:hypothetical protein
MTDDVNASLCTHLIRSDGDEDLCFALWTPSSGSDRLTAMVNTVVLPEDGDRRVHGNVSFNQQYFRARLPSGPRAAERDCVLHSHLLPGWQAMSHDDAVAEQRSRTDECATVSLFGLTVDRLDVERRTWTT